MSRSRLNIFLEAEDARRLKRLSATIGKSKSAIIETALLWYLSPDGGDQREAATTKRLDRLSRQFEKLERDQNILIETLALWVRYSFAVSDPIPADHQDAARAQGKQRFTQFIEQLARHLQRGNSLVKDLHEEIFPQSAFDQAARQDEEPGPSEGIVL